MGTQGILAYSRTAMVVLPGKMETESQSKIAYIAAAGGELLSLVPPRAVVLSSARRSWDAITVEQLRLPPLEMPDNYAQDHLITLKLSPPSTIEWKTGGRFRGTRLLPGDVCLAPAETLRQLRWQEDVEILALAIDPTLVTRVAEEMDAPSRIELIETHGGFDPQVQHIGLALKAELESGGAGGRLYAESLATALAVRLLERYNAFSPGTRNVTAGLSPSRLRQAIAYIQDNLAQDISLAGVTEVLRMSPSRFNVLFKQSTGRSLHQYVIEQRVERAKYLLLRGDLTPGQVAARVGFYDQSHLNRHFKRLVGLTPGDFLRQE